jgi:hypothetical protein
MRVVSNQQPVIDPNKGARFIGDIVIDRVIAETNIPVTSPAEGQGVTLYHQPLTPHCPNFPCRRLDDTFVAHDHPVSQG